MTTPVPLRPAVRRAVSLLLAVAFLGPLLSVAGSVAAPPGAAASSPPSLVVSAGYADSLRPNGFFPNPWSGSPGVIFEGCSAPTSCTFDGGAIEIVNTSGSQVTINSVTAQFSTCTFNIWPTNVSLPAGGTVIYAQVASGASGGCQTDGSFDTSDVGPNGVTWSSCSNSGVIPQVNITVNNILESFTDSGQVLNTGGIDLANCPLGSNESKPWTQINGTMTPDQQLGAGSPSSPQIPSCNQTKQPINCATGNFWHTFDELSIPGRGVAGSAF